MGHPEIRQQATFFYTEDLESTHVFYQDIIGLTMVLDQGVCRIYQTSSQAFIGFCEKNDVNPNHDDVIFTLITHDVDGWFEYLQSNGLVLEKEPVHNPNFNIYHLFLRDPNGYLIEIQKFLDPSWPE